MEKKVKVSKTEQQQLNLLVKLLLLLDDKFKRSLDGVILEFTAQAVIKRLWVKDYEKRFMPSDIFKEKEFITFAKLFPEVFSESISKLMQTGESQICVYVDFDHNEKKWYRAKFRKIYSGAHAVRLVCEIDDITAEQIMADQLKAKTAEIDRNNNLLDIGMEISQMSGWEYDLRARELLVTRQFSAILEANDFIMPRHDGMMQYFSPAHKYLLLRTLKKSLELGCNFDIELELNCISNKKKWVRIAGVPTWEDGEVRFFRGIVKDISGNKRHQLELIAAKNMAEQIAKKRTEILSILSHEIRTPLNGIIGISNLLNQMVFEKPNVSGLIRNLNISSNHLLDLVNDILDLEKIRNKKIELNETESNVVTLTEQIRSQFSPMAKEKRITLTACYDKRIPKTILVDELRLTRVLNNLVSNAIKFTETGEVSISLETVHESTESVKILFRIRDTGIGIPDHFHNLIFDKFLQIQQASHRKQQGTGLGLSITKNLLKLFNSEIVLASTHGEGTTFEFEIDFKLPANSKPEETSNSEKQVLKSLPPFNLLIVDDNQCNLLVAKSQVRNFGIIADLAENGWTALEMLRSKCYDVILIDLHMPDMDGYALAAEVKRVYPDIKIIIFTADVLMEVRKRLKAMGVSHILSKPFRPEEMHSTLLRALRDKA